MRSILSRTTFFIHTSRVLMHENYSHLSSCWWCTLPSEVISYWKFWHKKSKWKQNVMSVNNTVYVFILFLLTLQSKNKESIVRWRESFQSRNTYFNESKIVFFHSVALYSLICSWRSNLPSFLKKETYFPFKSEAFLMYKAGRRNLSKMSWKYFSILKWPRSTRTSSTVGTLSLNLKRKKKNDDWGELLLRWIRYKQVHKRSNEWSIDTKVKRTVLET